MKPAGSANQMILVTNEGSVITLDRTGQSGTIEIGGTQMTIATALPASGRRLEEEENEPEPMTYTHAEWNRMHEEEFTSTRPNRRRLRRASFMVSAGSFTLSAGSNRCGND